MLDRHAVQELVRAKVTAREIAKQLGVSVRTVRRIVREGEVLTGSDATARSDRQVGRPRITDAIRAQVHTLVLEDPERPPGEIWRLLREAGVPEGFSFTFRNRGIRDPYEALGIWLVDQWRQIGLTVKVETLELATLYNEIRGGNFDVYVMNADGSGLHQVTFDPAYDGRPSWSPDGTRLSPTWATSPCGTSDDSCRAARTLTGMPALTRSSARSSGPSAGA